MPNIKNLVFEGGGVKGIAYVGALEMFAARKQLGTVEHVAGASAGAITALLLGIGYSHQELKQLLDMDFSTFMDGHRLSILRVAHAARTFGAHPGEAFHQWISKLIAIKLDNNSNATFADLHEKVILQGNSNANAKFRDVHIIGTNLSTSRAEVFSYYTTPDMPLADAVRISMSIPLFFEPKVYEKDYYGEFKKATTGALLESGKGDMYVDGGLADNYPIQLFDNGYPNPETLGLRVDPPEEIAALRDNQITGQPINSYADYGMAVLNAAMSAQARNHELDNFRTLFIDTGTISTVQFKLTEVEKQKLIQAGRDAAEHYFASLINPKTKDPGSRLLANQQRHEKQDRYGIYQRASVIYRQKDEQGQGRIQLIFKPTPTDDAWVIRRKVTKYYDRLSGQMGILSLKQAKCINGHEQVLSLTVDLRLIEELELWLTKHEATSRLSNLPLTEDALVLLAANANQGHPSWMVVKDKHSRFKAEMFKWLQLGAFKEVSSLLKQGAATSYCDERGNQPLHMVAGTGNPALLTLLLDNHALINSQNSYGDTPLHLAAKYDVEGDSVAILLSRGANVNSQNKLGMTPIMLAAEKGHITVVKQLYKNGARTDLTDKEGKTALDKAKASGREEVINYLKPMVEQQLTAAQPTL